jgi:hypothetical protein
MITEWSILKYMRTPTAQIIHNLRIKLESMGFEEFGMIMKLIMVSRAQPLLDMDTADVRQWWAW